MRILIKTAALLILLFFGYGMFLESRVETTTTPPPELLENRADPNPVASAIEGFSLEERNLPITEEQAQEAEGVVRMVGAKVEEVSRQVSKQAMRGFGYVRKVTQSGDATIHNEAAAVSGTATKSRGTVSCETMGNNTLLIPKSRTYASINQSAGDVVNSKMVIPGVEEVARLNQEGTNVYAGHVSYSGRNGALFNLARVTPGDIACVKVGGITHKYTAVSIQQVDKDAVGADLDGDLVVVTCGGELKRVDRGWHFDDNIVVKFRRESV